MARREDLLRQEAEGWARIDALVEGLTPEEIDRPGLTDEGWSVKDMMWHVAAWSEDTARVLREMEAGTWDGEDPSEAPGYTDRVNREWFARSRTMEVEQARSAWYAMRARMLEAFGALGEVTPDAGEWFEESGPSHYAEHLPGLQAWVERSDSSA
ncbi:MAG: maleylpyruvate isomerase N-terminal domain-containing protein [Actinomycetota bacterium]